MKRSSLKDKYKLITAPLRLLPNFIIIGAQKGGTSSMFSYLKQHPQLQLPDIKEIHFFDNNYQKGSTWYKSHFPLIIVKNKLTGEASPYYLFHPHVPQRVIQLCPKVKLIVMLRNPADRAYSHYMMQNKRKIDPLPTFEEAIDAEESRLRDETLRLGNEKPSNLKPQNTNDYQSMKSKTRGMLNEYYAIENKKLIELLGNDFLWKA